MVDGVKFNVTEVKQQINSLAEGSSVEKDVQSVSESDIQSVFEKTKNSESGSVSTYDYAQTFLVEEFDYSIDDLENLSDEDYELFEQFGAIDEDSSTISKDESDSFAKFWDDYIARKKEALKEDERIKEDEDGNKYVNVESYVDDDNTNNGSLSRIIANSYDLEALGIDSFSCAKYQELEKLVMDANPNIYGDADGVGGNDYLSGYEGERNYKILYDGDKLVLPTVELPKVEHHEATRGDLTAEEIQNLSNGVKAIVDSANIDEAMAVVDNSSSDVMAAVMEQYAKDNGSNLIDDIQNKFDTKLSTELMPKIAEHVVNTALLGDESSINILATEIAKETVDELSAKGPFASELARNWSQLNTDVQVKLANKTEEIRNQLRENEKDKQAVGTGNEDTTFVGKIGKFFGKVSGFVSHVNDLIVQQQIREQELQMQMFEQSKNIAINTGKKVKEGFTTYGNLLYEQQNREFEMKKQAYDYAKAYLEKSKESFSNSYNQAKEETLYNLSK